MFSLNAFSTMQQIEHNLEIITENAEYVFFATRGAPYQNKTQRLAGLRGSVQSQSHMSATGGELRDFWD